MFITNPQLPVYKIESLIIDGDLVLEPTECDDSIILMIKNESQILQRCLNSVINFDVISPFSLRS